MREKRDLYTKDGELTNKTYYKGDIIPDNYYPMVVMIAIENYNNEFLMQKRVPEKGGDWGVTGGHPKSGETPIEGIITEVKEELGLDEFHIYDSIVTLPTCSSKGYTTHICKNCSDSYIDSYIFVGNHSFDVDEFVDVLADAVSRLREMSPLWNQEIDYDGVMCKKHGDDCRKC